MMTEYCRLCSRFMFVRTKEVINIYYYLLGLWYGQSTVKCSHREENVMTLSCHWRKFPIFYF